MKTISKIISLSAAALVAAIAVTLLTSNAQAKDIKLLNVSYDPTRELYTEFNAAFVKHWKAKSGDTLTIQQSHDGSGKQARKVIDGLEADVVTLALGYDVQALYERAKLIPQDWQKRLPNNSSPYTSTIVFLVRKGNPKGIKDWDDLAKPGISVVTPNPKTSGGARWNYLAAWAWASQKFNADDTKIKDYIAKLCKNVVVWDTGARGSTTTFVQREIGDVLITWENEAYLTLKEYGADKFEIVNPSLSILAEPPVTWVDKSVKRHGTEDVAKAYLEYLYTPEGQEIAAKNFYRPRLAEVAEKYKSKFAEIKLVTIETFGGWTKAHATHFAEGGTFDQIYKP